MRARVYRNLLIASLCALLFAAVLPLPARRAAALHRPRHPIADQGLNRSEEPAFRKSLRALLEDADVDMVVTLRRMTRRRAGCRLTGRVYWVYAARGAICFTRSNTRRAWRFKVDRVRGKNPLARRDHTALATLRAERAASARFVEDPDRRNFVAGHRDTYPYAYERIAAEFDSTRSGDFVIVPDNTADRGGKGAHGNLNNVQSRTTLIVSGRGARRAPLSKRAERRLRIKNVDIAPTVAKALGVRPYFTDTKKPGRLLNGRLSRTALLERQDGRVLDKLLEPVFNTIVVSVDGLRPQYVEAARMPNLTRLLGEKCEPGGTCATSYDQARAIMVTETNGNHAAMVTGAYGERSGMYANATADRSTGEDIDLDEPQLNLSETFFDVVEREKPWLRTALVMGKEKLRDLFDCTRGADGNCGPSSANPEKVEVEHVRPDFVAGATTSPRDPDLDCPAEPGSGSAYTSNECTMDAAITLLREEDPDFTFVSLPEVDGLSHLFGANSPQAQAAVASADEQIGKLVAALRESGKWQHSMVIVTADHNFGDTENLANTIFLGSVFSGAGPADFEIVTHGGSASVYVGPGNTALTDEQQRTLAELRKRALATPGVTEALYRLPNPVDGGDQHTIDAAHPAWRLGGTARVGELLILADETHAFSESTFSDTAVILGEHGHPTDRHVPFIVMSGGTYVRDRSVAASDPAAVKEGDDTQALPEQAENVDIASTLSWIYRLRRPQDAQGRVLSEAFAKHPQRAQRDGTITEPLANRAAIFIYDANNSAEVHCLLYPATCGRPVPDQAKDEDFIPNLRRLVNEGFLAAFGSMSAWPSVTFPNHNTVGSGAYPGHHGMVNNRFYIRSEKEFEAPIDPTYHKNLAFQGTSRLLTQDVETLHEAVHRSFGDWSPTDGPASDKAYTAAVDEPSARGADYATLEATTSYPNPADYGATQNPQELVADTTAPCAEDESYFQESVIDHEGQTQARRLYEDRARHPLPKYLINNFTITDGAGHKYGPHTPCTFAAYRDSDRRLGRILAAMRSSGALGETLIVVTGDHGMENQNLKRRGLPGDFELFLNKRGIKHVMADWHVYLKALDVKLSPRRPRRGVKTKATITVTDDDTREPVADAVVTIKGVRGGRVRGTTGDDGKVGLTFTARGRRIALVVWHDNFIRRRILYRTRR